MFITIEIPHQTPAHLYEYCDRADFIARMEELDSNGWIAIQREFEGLYDPGDEWETVIFDEALDIARLDLHGFEYFERREELVKYRTRVEKYHPHQWPHILAVIDTWLDENPDA